MGNNEKADVMFVGDVILILDSGFKLMLKDTFYVPSFRRNLVSYRVWIHMITLLKLKAMLFQYFLIQIRLGAVIVQRIIQIEFISQ